MSIVLVVPLTVAGALGALRIDQSLRAAADFAALADRVQVLPLLVELDGDAAVVMGTSAQRTITPEMIDDLDGSISALGQAHALDVLDESAATHLAVALDGARALSEQAKQGFSPTSALTDQLSSIRSALSSTVTSITEPISDAEIAGEARRLEDLWAAQKLISAQGLSVVASTAILVGESEGSLEVETINLLTYLKTEAALIEQLAQRYAPGNPTIEALQQGVIDRTMLVQNVSRHDNVDHALTGLKYSLFASIDDYSTGVAAVSTSLADAVAAESDALRTHAWRDMTIVGALLGAAILLAVTVARSLVQPLRRLRKDALHVAHTDLPHAIEQLEVGADVAELEIVPIDVHTPEEIGQVARAIDGIHARALFLAGEQARLRLQMNNVFESLARRSKSLIELQLQLIEQLESHERDPHRLDSLFRLDHLATRMRRNSDNLLVLAGSDDRRGRSQPIPLEVAVRAAISEVEHYQRVHISSLASATVIGPAGKDLIRVLAELFDNALQFSPPDSAVSLRSARAVDGGVVIEIVDRGIGMSSIDLAELNEKLASNSAVTPDTARHMGLFVAGQLARRHDFLITLRPSSNQPHNAGITASVHISAVVLISVEKPFRNRAAMAGVTEQ